MAMRAISVAFCLGVAAGAPVPTDDELEVMWARFQKEHSTDYPGAERSRVKAFRRSVLQAHAMNEEQGVNCTDYFDGPECVFGVTKFSAMFEDEFAMSMLGYRPAVGGPGAPVLSLEGLPEAPAAVDWRPKGAVTKVKNQGMCGSCWAFSAVEEVESAAFMATGRIPTLSTQQVVACDKVDGGCDGGNTETAYAYIKKAGGLDTAADYPDTSSNTGRTGKCRWDKKEAVKVSGFQHAVKQCTKGSCKHQDEAGLAKVLAAKGPVSICVNAASWQNYQKGIYTKKCSSAAKNLDHCVQLVGYDKSGKTPYWIVRNSWATGWGIDGYMHLKMGDNACGVANDATIVEVEKELFTV